MEPSSQTILWAILALFGKEVVSYFVSKSKDNSKALDKNTQAIIRLEERIQILIERTDSIPRIREDLNHLHSKIRDLKINS